MDVINIGYITISFCLGVLASCSVMLYWMVQLSKAYREEISELKEENSIFYEVNGKLHKSLIEKDYEIQNLEEQLNK